MDEISLVCIEPSESNAMYVDAFQSYKEIYNNCIVKGKGNLDPRFLGGNPIQLDVNNMGSIFSFSDYYVTTKANGLRFMLIIGNQDLDKIRYIYFVDSNMKFWYIKQIPKLGLTMNTDSTGIIPPLTIDLNVDKCLIDGELLFWGNVTTRKVNKEIKEYIITKSEGSNPLIAFSAFDILFGPMNPEYSKPIVAIQKITDPEASETEGELSHTTVFKLGNSAPMIGPKAAGRWPASKRRHVLEQMFLNKDSPLWDYLHIQSSHNLNTIVFSKKDNVASVIEGHRYGFTIFVSPIILMERLMQKSNSTIEIYEYMKYFFTENIKKQYFVVDYTNYKTEIRLKLPKTPERLSSTKGRGLSTDGLIFTPIYSSYLTGPWTFCGNRQYKWKPVEELTIDFEIGIKSKDDDDAENYYYYGLVKKGKNVNGLKFSINDKDYNAVIISDEELTKGSIVECIFDHKNDDTKTMYFNIVQQRFDKAAPNSYLTAVSVLNGSNIRGEFNFLKKHGVQKPNILDLVIFTRNAKNTKNDDDMKNVINALSKETLIKCHINKHPGLIFGEDREKIIKMVKMKQENNSYELEVRINLGNKNYNYTNCLMESFVKSEYLSVPVVKIYGKDNEDGSSLRSVYALLGETPAPDLMLFEETINKIKIDDVSISDLDYNYDFDIVLSDEVKVDDKKLSYENKKVIGNTEYQYRYNITNISKFWVINIIEYGNSNTLEKAKVIYDQTPRVRVEIEYSPASYLEDLLKWQNENVLNIALKEFFSENVYIVPKEKETSNLPSHETLVKNFVRYKNELNNVDPEIIVDDLGRVLIEIFKYMDMEVGNNYGENNAEKKKKKEEKKKEGKVEKKEGKVEKKGVEEDGGMFFRMRKFHNYVKSMLIGEISKSLEKPISLLDISVGEGGDLMKWEHADIDFVYGIDPNKKSIAEANDRLAEMKSTGKIKKSRDYSFKVDKITNPRVNIKKEQYDIVSCQFSMHYIFENDDMLETMVSKVSDALKEGGYFIGTMMIGTRVKALIKNNKFKDKIETHEIDQNSYKMKLLDTKKIYTSDNTEYYVNLNRLKEVCDEHSLKFRESKDFAEIYRDYKKDRRYKQYTLENYEMEASFINSTFIFEKSLV